jgi:hypothetical protein
MVQLSPVRPDHLPYLNIPLIALPRPPRSVDRTQSPVAVSQKREYFKYPPETIGDFSPEPAKFGIWRPTANPQSPPMAGIFANSAEKSLSARLVGWRRSADRTRLHNNSLLTGNFTGNFVILERCGPIL